uniref:Uncharacterized protein n=1 Tax=Cynoglossus semilaevis TaxID=244447 RepID=A0A3P8VWG9_CYNSE
NIVYVWCFFFPVLFSLFLETEANYERLRIAGLVCAFLLMIGGLSVIICKCPQFNKDTNMDLFNHL